MEGEKEKLLRLDEILHQRMIGQHEAVQAVCDAVIRACSGLKDPERPMLLQILDDGRLTDSQGRTVDFKNSLIIMTSNIGSPHLIENASETGEIAEIVCNRVMSAG